MKQAVLHDRQQETIEAKTRWFRSLSMTERMEVFCSFTDLILSVNDDLKKKNNAQPNVEQTNINDDTD
jgi:hypothetical protein